MTNDPDTKAAGFEHLLALFEHTHTAMQQQAARSVDRALVVRNSSRL